MSNHTADLIPKVLLAGASATDVTPNGETFLYGYPHVPRISTGVHDPLMASALALQKGSEVVLFVSVDVIFLAKDLVREARRVISEATGIAASRIMVSATHTHSGPVTIRMISNADDPLVPPPDAAYLTQLVSGIVRAGIAAWEQREPAAVAQVMAVCPELGGNRHDPAGPTMEHIPVLAARSVADPSRMLAMMYVNRVHPTVLHEDSTLISGDFPGLCRRRLQQKQYLGDQCPVLGHLGAAGDQSPRHVVRSNTLEEAERLGHLLADALLAAIADAEFTTNVDLQCTASEVELPMRSLPSVAEADRYLDVARHRFDELRASNEAKNRVRTAECAVFGAEETLCLARAAESGDLHEVADACMPAEIQVITIGHIQWVGWPGEVFAEYALDLDRSHPQCAVITLANGELQGYVVTEQAVADRVYEASNALFASPQSGEILVNETRSLLAKQAPLLAGSPSQARG